MTGTIGVAACFFSIQIVFKSIRNSELGIHCKQYRQFFERFGKDLDSMLSLPQDIFHAGNGLPHRLIHPQ
ncbi:hypothetical protein [Methylophaga sp. OBS4]|uniref:hypothetical protein n=1 Tax=Methylophaga sp. OBS4 TaxID=2991935 RepID=UPI00225AB872|nr:hypothetical protein [Methylophaga sp. OBS4]MCX4186312.1 hypothetical protein [Methylophaga sp. OBS4]